LVAQDQVSIGQRPEGPDESLCKPLHYVHEAVDPKMFGAI
uniref:ABC transporter ATP-binding protein n=1 Tax=Steinernema glaseri TaxID=37863 RepID=A0A1I7Y562_9BILA